ncbi:MAG: thermonuclease family protein [Phycisphaeraceae bacterium]
MPGRKPTRRQAKRSVGRRKPTLPPRPNPLALRLALKRRKAGALAIALILVFAIACIDRFGGVLPVQDDWRKYHGQSFAVARVIDGDTIDLRVPDGDKPTTRVRLWGVDTPELAKPDKSLPAEPWAEEARAYTRERVEGRRVTLELQKHRARGRYGRVLAYVRLDDGADLNAELIERGLSEHDDRWSHDRSEQYADLERDARQGGRGLWSD